MAKKSRNVLKELSEKRANANKQKLSDEQKAPETNEKPVEDNSRTADTLGKSRKKQSIEDKRAKDREYQKEKYDRQKEENKEQTEREARELSLAIETFACMPFDLLAQRNEVWLLNSKERLAFTQSTKSILDKYAGFLSGYSVETSFVLTLGAILIPRLSMNGQKKKSDIGHTGKEGDRQDVSSKTDDGIQK